MMVAFTSLAGLFAWVLAWGFFSQLELWPLLNVLLVICIAAGIVYVFRRVFKGSSLGDSVIVTSASMLLLGLLTFVWLADYRFSADCFPNDSRQVDWTYGDTTCIQVPEPFVTIAFFFDRHPVVLVAATMLLSIAGAVFTLRRKIS